MAEQKRVAPIDNTTKVETVRGEFAPNGPLLNIILEYLLNSAAALGYAIRFPSVRVLNKLAAGSSPTRAITYAIQTKNKENAEVITRRFMVIINWSIPFNAAVKMGSVKIMDQMYHAGRITQRGINIAMALVARTGHLPAMRRLATWGANPALAFDTARTSLVIREAVKLGANCDFVPRNDLFVRAADKGRIGVMDFLWRSVMASIQKGATDPLQTSVPGGVTTHATKLGLALASDFEFNADRRNTMLQGALRSATKTGRVKVVRHLLAIDPKLDCDYAFEVAAARGHLSLCKFFVNCWKQKRQPAGEEQKGEKKCEMGCKYPYVPLSRDARQNAAMSAAKYGRLAVLGFLRTAYGDKWTKRIANAALGAAAEGGQTSAARMLVAGAPGIRAADNFEFMLNCATEYGHTECIALAKELAAR